MMGPAWLADLFALLMLAVAAHCLVRLIAAPLRRRSGDPDGERNGDRDRGWNTRWDIDLVHLTMGIAMAAMFVPRRNPLAGAAWNDAWQVAFALATGWFLLRAPLPRGTGDGRFPGSGGSGRGHRLPHVLHSGAMLFMYLAVPSGTASGSSAGGGTGMGGMSGMSGAGTAGMSGAGMGGMAGMSGTGSAGTLPTLAVLLAVLLTGYAVLVCDRASARPASGAAVPGCASAAGAGGDASGAGAATRWLRASRPVAAAEVAVSVAMAYMLVLTL